MEQDSTAVNLEALTRALDVQTLRILLAVDENGTITAAARALGYSQPAITQHLQRSEARIGIPLVTRAPRGVQLTEAGALLARHAPRIDAALTAAAAELASHLGLDKGTVRVAAFPASVATIVAPLLARLEREFP